MNTICRALAALLLLLCLTVPAEGAARKKAARILVKKSEHTMQLFASDGETLGTYTVSLGPGGPGHKRMEGDKVTPTGRYHVTAHHPSRFKVFMGIDYPNAEDRARFWRLRDAGELPRGATIGGAVGIHGGTPADARGFDWTLGCIAVTDDEIVEIARIVSDGTVVDIED